LSGFLGIETIDDNDTFQLFSSEVDTNLLGKGWFSVSVICVDASGNSANTTTDIFVADDFEVDVSTDKSIYDRGEYVNISGSAHFSDGSAVDNTTVFIDIDVRGFGRTFNTQTDIEGRFNYSFVPFVYEAGNYSLRATVDYQGLERSNGTVFSINGLCLRPGSETVDMAEDSVYVFNLTLYNLGENTLTGIMAELVDQDTSDNVTGLLDTSTLPEVLLPDEKHSFALTLTAGRNSVGDSAFSVVVSSDQTSDEVSEINVSVHPNEPALDIGPGKIVAGLDLNESVIKSFTILNAGYGTLRNVSIVQPVTSWLRFAGDESIGDISPGGNTSLNVVFSSFNVGIGEYSEFINISSSNHETVSLEVKLYVNDSGSGSLLFYVGDALSRNVSGANISLVDELTFEGYNLTTNEEGYALFENLPVGKYFYDIFAGNGTMPQMGSVEVEPMPEPKLVNITLGMSFMDFEWDVEPTTINDVYNIILKLKFETDIPVPILLAHPPVLIYNLEPGQSASGWLYLNNSGLVALRNIKLTEPYLRRYVNFKFLVNEIPEIKAKGAVKVPFIVNVSKDARFPIPAFGVIQASGNYIHSVGGVNTIGVAGATVPVWVNTLVVPSFCVKVPGGTNAWNITPECLSLNPSFVGIFTIQHYDIVPIKKETLIIPINATNCNPITETVCDPNNASNCTCIPGKAIKLSPAVGILLSVGLEDIAKELLPDRIIFVAEKVQKQFSHSERLLIKDNLIYYEELFFYSYKHFRLFFDVPLTPAKAALSFLGNLGISLPHVDSVLLGNFDENVIKPTNSTILRLNRTTPPSVGLSLPKVVGGGAGFLFGPDPKYNCLALLPIGGIQLNVDVNIPPIHMPHLPTDITWYIPHIIPGSGGSGGDVHISGGFWFPSWVSIPSPTGDGGPAKRSNVTRVQPTAISRTVHEVVRLYISQNATMERDAFWAGLGVYNRMSDKSIDNLDVDIIIRDSEGRADDEFFICSPHLTGISDINGGGSIPALGIAKAQWLIIPKPGAGGTGPEGKVYNISANICYSVDGVNYELSTLDVQILVKPQPQIVLDYYIPSDVIANSPFKLAVKATNEGYGTARDFKISSAQPVIYDNAAGLMIDFKILDGSGSDLVDVDFGDIEPGESEFKWWEMVTTLDGTFTEFTSSYTHSPELGGMETSLIKELNTHIIMREIDTGDITYDLLVDSDRNGIPDYVIDALYGTATEVLPVSYTVVRNPTLKNPILTIRAEKVENKWICTSVDDPYENKVPILMVACSDGRILSKQNYWMRDGRILIVDDPVQEYNITYETSNTTPPNIANVTVINITTKSATVKWDTDKLSDSLVKYGTESGNYTLQKYDLENVTSHSVNLVGLLPNTTYYFMVNSTDQSGNSNESSEHCFTTLKLLIDTGHGTYPSIMGRHKGEIKPSDNITVSKLYTYPCPGTGGHTESIELYENGELIANGTWNGYAGDWHNIT